MENSVRDHEDRIAKLEAASVNRSPWGSTAGSASGAASSAAPAAGELTPSYVELRGWATWEDRNVKGVRREEDVVLFMTSLKEHMPSPYHGHFGEPKLFGSRNIKVRIPIKAGMAWEMRGVVMNAIAHDNLLLGGVTPRVTVEDSPSGMAVKLTIGRLLDGAKALLAAKKLIGWEPVPDWKSKAVRCISGGQAGEHEVAHVSAAGLRIFSPDALRLVFGTEVAEYERHFASARRRWQEGPRLLEEVMAVSFNIQRQVRKLRESWERLPAELKSAVWMLQEARKLRENHEKVTRKPRESHEKTTRRPREDHERIARKS